MVFHASKLPKDYSFAFQQPFEEVNIPAVDGKIQNGLLFKVNNPKGLIFYLHGNAGALDSWGHIGAWYSSLGYDFFILDYRGFGKSDGTIEDENQVNEDIARVYDKIAGNYPKNKIIIIGYSIGTGPATYLASRKQPDKLILQAPFYNFEEFSSGVAPFIPDFLKKFKFETNKYISKVKAPVYLFHGTDDYTIPYENSVKLARLLKRKDTFFTLSKQGHLGMNDNPEYQQKVAAILY